MDRYQEAILETVEYLFNERIKDLKFNYTITGKIKSIDGGNLYTITYNNEDIQVKAIEGLNLEIGDIVKIQVNNNNFSDKEIIYKRP